MLSFKKHASWMYPYSSGHSGDIGRECVCYRKCISGQMLKRIDIHIEVSRFDVEVRQFCELDESRQQLVKAAMTSFNSPRAPITASFRQAQDTPEAGAGVVVSPQGDDGVTQPKKNQLFRLTI